MKKLRHITDVCKEIYEKKGFAAVCEYANKVMKTSFDIQYEICKACDTEAPAWRHVCLACGQETAPRKLYFEIISQGWNKGLGREEIQVHCGENGNLMIIKTEEGYIVDAIDVGGNNINTMCVWEDDINPLVDDEESGAPENFSDVEIQEFKENWGQSHGEITSELGFPKSHAKSDDLIIATGNYFWDEKDKKWYNKCASMFTPREQAIADYLRLG